MSLGIEIALMIRINDATTMISISVNPRSSALNLLWLALIIFAERADVFAP
jgi:hypothetical protein